MIASKREQAESERERRFLIERKTRSLSMVGAAAARGDEAEEAAAPPTSIAAACAASILPRRILFHPPLKAPPPSSSSSAALIPLNLPVSAPPPSSHCNGDCPLPSNGKSCTPLSRPPPLPLSSALVKRIGAGLNNLGNTCFLNSVLQCLTYTPPLATYFQGGLHKISCRAVAFCAMCALENHVKQALSATGRVISPNQLVKNLRCISRSFQMGRQEDAHEYMRYLIEALQKCCPLDARANASPSSQRNFIQRIFAGRLQSQVKCTECAHSSKTYDPFLDLSLDIVKAESLLKALTRFTAIEVLDGDNKYFCSKCKKKVRAHKQFTIDYAPHVLTVQFKRFSSSGGFGGKIDKNVHFDRTLNLTPFVNGKGGAIKYSLYGVLVHAGWSTHSGHYYCFVRTSADVWHRLDDSRVSQVSERSVLEQKAYILFYVRDAANLPIANGNHQGGASEKFNLPHATNGGAKVETNNGVSIHASTGQNGSSLCMNSKHSESSRNGVIRVQANGFSTSSIITTNSSNVTKSVEVLGNRRATESLLITIIPKTSESAPLGDLGRDHQSSFKVQGNGVLANGHTGKNGGGVPNGAGVRTNGDMKSRSIFSPEKLEVLSNGSKVPQSLRVTGKATKANGVVHYKMNGMESGLANGGCGIAKVDCLKEHTTEKLERQAGSSDGLATGDVANMESQSCGKSAMNLPLSNAPLLPVPRWEEDAEHSTENVMKEKSVLVQEVAHCGHILDEWDEEYDRGKQKKVRNQIPSQQGTSEVSEHIHKKRKKNGLSPEHSDALISNERSDNLFQALVSEKVNRVVDISLLRKRRKRKRAVGHKLFLKRHRFKQLHANRRHRRKR